ncbi:MAG: type II and III secretion system protein [Gammaproteobacteria bacterium]|nr:MAG: pilus (MSHA type) biogenesis protein MshL [Pseudomonadota bacterium]MBC6944887.1 pilus (MSHA type) biogenesis protein MshL [Gammaproteobacteria bacterium]MCE7895771.1 pilus (MSHA type) biogenesis protein MshL [Gammaproteobacteria bacterium PRO8]MDL1879681.1 pilus (MSHA type) biogenesis protein MshL [Gammaproteobacteria bacterium PRO2]GIK35598.1 MAG: type II and III secretion system protein [Gammaproteobacteria bacterium]
MAMMHWHEIVPAAASLPHRLLPVVLAAGITLVAGCGPLMKYEPAPGHLESEGARQGIPATVGQVPLPPPPQPAQRPETFSVVVTDMPVRDVLFALARDAGINVDIHGDIQGRVTMNAIDQTLPQLLERISRQVSLRYQLEAGSMVVMPDAPFWRNYAVDYVNLARTSEGEVSVATQVSTTGESGVDSADSGSSSASGGGSDDGEGNTSRTKVKSVSDNSFWNTLAVNIRQLVTGRAAADGAGAEATAGAATDPVVANPIAGVISVLATQAGHAQVQAYIDQVTANAKRQVLIEVTVVEVNLSDAYQAGVDWSKVSSAGGAGKDGISMLSTLTGNNLAAPPVFTLTYNNFDADGSGFSAAVKLLAQFGDTKVLSSPRIMALNNQTALLKVVDERVYFSLKQDTVEGTNNNNPRTIITSEIHTVPVGFVMSVTPQINPNGNVSLNVRPTLTRILGFASDPAPQMMGADFENLVPEIHVNEIESLLEVADGQTVVLGGLMTDELQKNRDEIPLLGRLPGIGHLFSYRDDAVRKSELVLFLRPTVIRSAGVAAPAVARAALPTSLAAPGIPSLVRQP